MSTSTTTSGGPPSLASIQVDLTTRLGTPSPPTPTGFEALDEMLAGGLRRGTLLSLSGEDGSGKTALSLLIAYMAARTGAAVLFAGVALDDTELLSRLVARALYREWPTLRESYSTIWSGEAWRNEATRKPLSSAVEAVMKKVGGRLHLFRAAPFQPLRAVEQAAAHLWSRHERVLLVVDGLDGFSAEEDAGARSTAVGPGGVLRAAYHLRQMSDKGCAVLVTVGAALHRWVTPAATLSAALRPGAGPAPAVSEAQALLGARAAELVVTKNQRGGTGTLPLLFIAGASVFENRDA